MQNGEPNMWTGLAILRNGQVQRRWQRLQMLLVFDMVAIPILFGGSASMEEKSMISVVGFFIHIFLIMASWRGERWNRLWSRKMGALERVDRTKEGVEIRIEVFASREYARLQHGARWFSRVAYAIAMMTIITWAVLWIHFMSIIYGWK